MRKNKILAVATIFEILVFILTLFVKINNFELKDIWFSSILFLISIYALIYASLFQLDSCLYFGIAIFGVALCSAFFFFNEYSFMQTYPFYLICLSFADLAVFVLFRQNIHFKLFAILFVQGILLVSYKIKALNFYYLLTINLIFALFVIVNVIFRVRKNLRSKK